MKIENEILLECLIVKMLECLRSQITQTIKQSSKLSTFNFQLSTFNFQFSPFVTSVPMASPVTTFSRLPGWFMSNT